MKAMMTYRAQERELQSKQCISQCFQPKACNAGLNDIQTGSHQFAVVDLLRSTQDRRQVSIPRPKMCLRYAVLIIVALLRYEWSYVVAQVQLSISSEQDASTPFGFHSYKITRHLRAGSGGYNFNELNQNDHEPEERAFSATSKLKGAISKGATSLKTTKANVNQWFKQDKSVEYVLKKLGLHKLSAEAIKASAKFKHFDAFMHKKIAQWVESRKSVDDVKKFLGLDKLSYKAMKARVTYKYYDKFMKSDMLSRASSGNSIDDVKKVLNIGHLPAASLKTNENFKYLDDFMEAKVLRWLGGGSSIDDVRKGLQLDKLSGEALKASDNSKYYDQYMSGRVASWLRSGKTTGEVKQMLGLDKVSTAALSRYPDVKYYDEFLRGRVNKIWEKATAVIRVAQTHDDYMHQQVMRWAMKGKTVSQVKKMMGLSKLKGEALTSHINYKFVDEFMGWQVLSWVGKGKSIDEVKKTLGINKLSDDALKKSPSYKYYDLFMSREAQDWVYNGKSVDDVKKALGLDTLTGNALSRNVNTKYYDQFLEARVEAMWLRGARSAS